VPASAAPPPWIVAGDSNGALGNCDPAVLARTDDAGLSWTTQQAFQPTTLPCTGGGRINAITATTDGGWFAAGYRYTPAGKKQGVLYFSSNGSTWTLAREIPAGPNDTEYLDVSVSALHVVLWSGDAATSATHDVSGSMTSGWLPMTSAVPAPGASGLIFRDLDPQGGGSGVATMVAGSAIPSSGAARCGAIGVIYYTGHPSDATQMQGWDGCISGWNVQFESMDSNGPSATNYVAVGSATAPGQGVRPVAYKRSDPGKVTQLLPGEGALKSVQLGANGVLVAVGSRKVPGGSNVASIFRSTDDGATWSSIPTPSGAKPLNEVINTLTGFVAVGDGGTILRSTDGLSWSTVAAPQPAPGAAPYSLRAIAVKPF